MLLAVGLGGLKPIRELGIQLTLFQPGGILCPSHYNLPTRIWKPNDISAYHTIIFAVLSELRSRKMSIDGKTYFF